MVGDMNGKIKNGKTDGELFSPLSRNGRIMISTLIDACKLKVMNFSEKCSGKWTHVIRTTGDSSVIDYVMVTDESKVKSMVIDEAGVFCPFRLKGRKGKRQVLSDHNAVIVEIALPVKASSTRREEEFQQWILTDDGIEMVEDAIKEIMEKNRRTPDTGSAQEVYNMLESTMYQVMDKGRRRKKKKGPDKICPMYVEMSKKINSLSRKGKEERKVANVYRKKILKLNAEAVAEEKATSLEKVLEQITVDGNFNAQCFWKIRKAMGRKDPMCTSVINEDGKEVYGVEGIKKVFEQEFKNRLQPREIEKGYENIRSQTEELCRIVLENCQMSKEDKFGPMEYEEVRKKLKKGKATGMDMLPAEVFANGGKEIDKLVLQTFNVVKERQVIPHQWNHVGVATIYKNKGNKKELVNQRGIFLTQVLSKMFERMVAERMKDTTSKISKLQAGGQDGRATYHQTFLLRSFIAHAKYTGTTLYLTFYDFKQCFDNLWLEDAILSLWKLGFETDLLPLIYKMNEEAVITVKTPLGRTDSFKLPCVCKQGTVLIPPMCSASVAECCEEHENGGASIGSLHIKSLAFMDDLLNLNTAVRDVHGCHEEVVFYSKKKKMPVNEDKCIVMIINSKSPHPQPQLMINDKILKVEEETRYLGDMFNAQGNNKTLIKDRTAKATRCLVSCFAECFAVTKGCKAIRSLLLLYKTVYIPTVIFNSESWDNLSNQDLAQLQVIQLRFLKRILQVPKSTPNCLVFMELGVVPIKYEIKSRQLNFLHQILTLERDDPVRRCFGEQERFPYEKNWVSEVRESLKVLQLQQSDDEIAEMSKEEWKRTVKNKIREKALEELIFEKSKLKKGAAISCSELGMSEYFDDELDVTAA